MTKRLLKEELYNLIRSRIPLDDDEIRLVPPNELVAMAARALEGVVEEGGNNRGRIVEMIQYVCGGDPGDSWCMYSMQVCVRFAELTLKIQSPLFASGHCKTVADNSPECEWHPPMTFNPGMIKVWLNSGGPSGHCGEVLGFYKDLIVFTAEGNTSSGVGIDADGGGFFHRMRKARGEGVLTHYKYLLPFPGK